MPHEQSTKRVNIVIPSIAEIVTETDPQRPASPVPSYSPPRRPVQSDDILFAQPTFSDKCMRYLFVVIYLGGLSSLGFILSIYYIFFWDSRMPPVFKPTKKPPTFLKP